MSRRRLDKPEMVSLEIERSLAKVTAWLRADDTLNSTLSPEENAELVMVQHLLVTVYNRRGSDALFKYLVAVGGLAGDMFEADAAQGRQH